MRAIRHIYIRDLRRLQKNKIAAFIMLGVCLLPSLYAWFNIFANIDPYGHTAGIRVAVANEDQSTALRNGHQLDAGAAIVDKLHKNHQLGWTFVDTDTAEKGVRAGDFYAAIIIPKDFSARLASIEDGAPVTPELRYLVNEKKNSIAPKITESDATSLVESINSAFSKEAAIAITTALSRAAFSLSQDVDGTKASAEAQLTQIEHALAEAQRTLADLSAQSQQMQTRLQSAEAALTELETAVNTLRAQESALAKDMAQLNIDSAKQSHTLADDLIEGSVLVPTLQQDADAVLSKFNIALRLATDALYDAGTRLERLEKAHGALVAHVTTLHEALPHAALRPLTDSLVSDLNERQLRWQALDDHLLSLNRLLKDSLIQNESQRKQLSDTLSQSGQTLTAALSDVQQAAGPLNRDVQHTIQRSHQDIQRALDQADVTAQSLRPILKLQTEISPQMNKWLADLSQVLNHTASGLAHTRTELAALGTSKAYQNILKAGQVSKEAVADFIAEPIRLSSTPFYPVANYGAAMTPFYTNLALWVGALILVAIIRLDVDAPDEVGHPSSRACWIGRWLLFISAGFVQALAATLGILYLLHIPMCHPWLFVGAGLFTSLVYVTFVYALATVFRHVGKALAVILMILQIPGSSGIYPVQMMPPFFQWLHPTLPFTYGIHAMREAIAGLYGHAYVHHLLILTVFLALGLFIGLGVRPITSNVNLFFNDRLSETRLMVNEKSVCHASAAPGRLVLAMMADPALKARLKDRAVRFEKHFPRLVRLGFWATAIFAVLLLAGLFGLEAKIVWMVLFISALLLLAVYLIVLEYLRYRFRALYPWLRLSDEAFWEKWKEEHR